MRAAERLAHTQFQDVSTGGHHTVHQGHGYVEAAVVRDNPYYTAGTTIRGHEFHYSKVVHAGEGAALRLDRGRGLGDATDGVSVGRVWASYTHVHALGTPSWAPAVTGLARVYRRERNGASAAWA